MRGDRMENKPNQHYVWQNYLKPWTTDDKISCLRERKKIINPNTRNIASQRYFYGVDGLVLRDCEIMRKAFIEKKAGYTKQMLLGWIKPIEVGIAIRDLMQNMGYDTCAEIDLYLKNMLEEVYTAIEAGAIPGLNRVLSQDIDFLYSSSEEDTTDIDFIAFLCFQYFRTKRMKEAVIQNIGESATNLFSDFGKAFNIIALILATQFGGSLLNLIKEGAYHCYLLKNECGTPFLTGDQPIINTFATATPKIEPDELELYYPVSPKLALLISNKTNHDVNCSVEDVLRYNHLIVMQSWENVFAADELILKRFLI